MGSWHKPLLMSFLAGLSTTIGGAFVFVMRSQPSDNMMAFVLSGAAGVMVSVSVCDLWFPAVVGEGIWTVVVRTLYCIAGVVLTQLLQQHQHTYSVRNSKFSKRQQLMKNVPNFWCQQLTKNLPSWLLLLRIFGNQDPMLISMKSIF
eukprot:c4533_g1_i2.p2 GENE.c4533_g1_i2~~c4533_g1_i2.p2  ORF type:complete len:166 (+),score=46.01 c4533_g1_i2:58-498(+)